jgi:hypothetical protein
VTQIADFIILKISKFEKSAKTDKNRQKPTKTDKNRQKKQQKKI